MKTENLLRRSSFTDEGVFHLYSWLSLLCKEMLNLFLIHDSLCLFLMQPSQMKTIEINTSATEAWKTYDSLYKYIQPLIKVCNFIIGNFVSHENFIERKTLECNNSYFKCSSRLISVAQPLKVFHIKNYFHSLEIDSFLRLFPFFLYVLRR